MPAHAGAHHLHHGASHAHLELDEHGVPRTSLRRGSSFEHPAGDQSQSIDERASASTGYVKKAAGLGYTTVGDQRDTDAKFEPQEPDFDWSLLEAEPGYEEADWVVQAGCWMKEANLGCHPPYGGAHFQTQRQVECYKRMRSLQGYFVLCNFAFISLAFLEVPPWCPDAGCPDDIFIPRLIHNSVPTPILICFEVCLLSVYLYRLWLNGQIYLEARSKLFHAWRGAGMVCISLSLASLVIMPVFGSHSKFHRLLRMPIFISFTRGLRNTLTRVVMSLPASQNALTMIFLLTLFFCWMGMVLFRYTPAHDTYPSLELGLKNFYVLITCNNMPNIMLDAIARSPLDGVFYVIFLILCVFLLMNVLLANIYDKYKALLTEEIIDFYKARRHSIDAAYHLLQKTEGGDAGIGQGTLAKFLVELIGDGSKADGVLEILDDDGSGKIEDEEFLMVAEVLADPNFHPHSGEGGLECLQPLEPYIEKLDKCCDYFSVAAALLVYWQTTVYAQSGIEVKGMGHLCYERSIVNAIIFLISMAYLVELVLEVGSNGFAHFLASDPFQNRFDLCTVAILAPLEIWFFVFGGLNAPPFMCRILTLIRGTRCLRILHKVPGPRDIIIKVYNGMEAFARVLLLLFCVCYVYAQVGMITMGGLVSKENKRLIGEDYDTSDFWSLNFNDMPSSLLLLFSHLIGNNSNSWADAFTDAFGDWVWYWFLFFDLLSNFIILNIIVALVIDCVMVPPPEQKEGEPFVWPDREDQIRKMFESEYLEELSDDQKENRQQLRDLFGAS